MSRVSNVGWARNRKKETSEAVEWEWHELWTLSIDLLGNKPAAAVIGRRELNSMQYCPEQWHGHVRYRAGKMEAKHSLGGSLSDECHI